MRHPVTQDGEARQGWGAKELKHNPVTDDVLDVIGHHREHRGGKISSKPGVMQRRKGNFLTIRCLNAVRGSS